MAFRELLTGFRYERKGNEFYRVSVCATQGNRQNMEDVRLISLSIPNHPDYSIYGVFDGHRGKHAAEYLSNKLLPILNELNDLDDSNKIINSIVALDKDFCATSVYKNQGCCIVFAIIKLIKTPNKSDDNDNNNDNTNNDDNITNVEYNVRIFWAGDSRAILINDLNDNNNFTSLTNDHTSSNINEVQRVQAAHGVISQNRLNGQLEVFRAFGDCSLKQDKNLSFEQQQLISKCDVNHIVCKKGNCLLLFCDGLVSDKNASLDVGNKKIVNDLKYGIKTSKNLCNAMSSMIVYMGIDYENVTAILIQFDNGMDYNKKSKKTSKKTNKQLDLSKFEEPLVKLKYKTDDEKTEIDANTQELITKFKGILSTKYKYNINNLLQSELLRYIVGLKYNLKKVEIRWKNLKLIEIKYKLNNININEIGLELSKSCYFIAGNDFDNREIIGFRINQLDPSTLNVNIMIKSILILFDSVFDNILSTEIGCILIFDMRGLNKSNISLKFQKIIIKTFQNAYPAKIKKIFIVDAPKLINGCITFAKMFVSQKMKQRIQCISSDNLLKYINKTQLPQYLNGTHNYNSNLYSNSWEYVKSKTISNININVNNNNNDNNDDNTNLNQNDDNDDI